ncbi:MAG: mercury methylation corrinoid protein HgcA [Thermodesulfobacteriota bacterium]
MTTELSQATTKSTGAQSQSCCAVSCCARPEEQARGASTNLTTDAASLPDPQRPFITGYLETPVGRIPRVPTELTWADRSGTIKVRWGIARMRYTVEPGLYAVGAPDAGSPVLVSANYKLSFDTLRAELSGISAWILVLDTNGINVWCAAGKGTFSTDELVQRIELTHLSEMVSHRQLILPQLAGPGVAAHEVKKRSGFKVIYGPIQARDIRAFLDAGNQATPEMRLKTFPIRERVILIPVELVEALKGAAILLPAFFLLGGLGGPADFWTNALNHGLFAAVAVALAIAAGAIVTPTLLPWLPGRAFAFKGFVAGLVIAAVLVASRPDAWASWPGRMEMIAWLLLVPALSAYLGMNFTGASSYTSLSGVKKEMRIALPLQIAAAAVGLVLWFCSRFTA